jgi:hypothetical protein
MRRGTPSRFQSSRPSCPRNTFSGAFCRGDYRKILEMGIDGSAKNRHAGRHGARPAVPPLSGRTQVTDSSRLLDLEAISLLPFVTFSAWVATLLVRCDDYLHIKSWLFPVSFSLFRRSPCLDFHLSAFVARGGKYEKDYVRPCFGNLDCFHGPFVNLRGTSGCSWECKYRGGSPGVEGSQCGLAWTLRALPRMGTRFLLGRIRRVRALVVSLVPLSLWLLSPTSVVRSVSAGVCGASATTAELLVLLPGPARLLPLR